MKQESTTCTYCSLLMCKHAMRLPTAFVASWSSCCTTPSTVDDFFNSNKLLSNLTQMAELNE